MSERELGQETASLEAVTSAVDPSSGPHSPDVPAHLGRTLAGRFKLIRFLGRGGMGEVYEARDLVLQTTVAVKALTGALADDASAIERLRREVLLARRVAHPNVCRIHELHEDREVEELTFISMELLDGETLAQHLKRSGPLAASEALPLLDQLAAGLGAIHHEGLVHRDFKPGNVMLVRSGASTRAVVMDFGIARAIREERPEGSGPTLTDSIGTPSYMAPEQLRGGELGPRTDVYALGLVSREMVGGTAPEIGRSSPRVPPGWKRVLRRATSEAPADRQATPGNLVRSLRRAGLVRIAVPAFALVLLALALMTQLVPRTAKLVRRAPVIPSSSARVAVVPVGADPATVALADALRTELSLPGAVRSNREEEGWPTARDSPAVDVGSPPPELLEGLRGRANSTFVILTNATPGDGATQVNLALYRTTDGRSLASTRLSGAPASFPDLAGRTGAWARSALGLPALTTEETRRLRAAHPATIDVAQRLASARTLLRLWRPGEALPLFEDVLKVEAGFAPALADYATALSRLGRNKAAAAARAHAAQAAMALPELLRVAIERDYWQGVGNSEEERRSNERLYQLTPDEASAVLAPRGRTSAQQLADLEALRAAQSPVTLDPRFDTVEARLAINQGNPSEALAAVDRGERKLAGYEDRHRRIAFFLWPKSESLRELGRLPEALAAERSAIETQRTDDQNFALARTLEINAGTLHDLRQWPAAARSMRQAREVWVASGADLGFSDDFRFADAVADNLLHLGEADEAAGELNAVQARYPDGCPSSQDCQILLTEIALARGRMGDAKAAAVTARKLGEGAVWWTLFALALAEGDLPALEAAREALRPMEEKPSAGYGRVILEELDIVDVQLAQAKIELEETRKLGTGQLPHLRTDGAGAQSALLRLESWLALARGDSPLALSKAEAALWSWTLPGRPPQAAIQYRDASLEWAARLQLARVLFARGARSSAEETLRPLEEMARRGGHKLLAMDVALVKVEGLPRGPGRREAARRLERQASQIGFGRIARLARGLGTT